MIQDIHQIEREINWHKVEVDKNKRDLEEAKRKVQELENKVRELDQEKRRVVDLQRTHDENERKLKLFVNDLQRASRK
ncbi:MAG: hypothetical protein V4486_03805 [Patescibacteria group bacterium]